MEQTVYKIPRVTDEQIHHSLKKISSEFGSINVHILVGNIDIGFATYPAAIEPSLITVLDQASDLISHFATHLESLTLTYYRGGASAPPMNKSPIFDDLTIEMRGSDPAYIKVMARVLELFRPVQLPQPTDALSLLESQRALQESSFSRLQLQLEKVFEQTIDLRKQLDEQVRSKEAALEEDFKGKELAASEAIQKQAKELEEREQELEERRKTIDESDNTFARRQIRDRMLNDVSARVQNFGLSKTTVASRRPVAIGMFILCAFLSLLLVQTLYELSAQHQSYAKIVATSDASGNGKVTSITPAAAPVVEQAKASAHSPTVNADSSGAEKILLWIRFTLVSLGLTASIMYYIRWQNQWATTFATTEQSLQQFHIDVNRANWVVETCLEWRKETDSDIPPSLIESLTRGLFAGRETAPSVLHPADELASALMGSASKLSLDLNGNKLEIDKPANIPKTVQAKSEAGD